MNDPYTLTGGATIIRGDAVSLPLGDETVDCIITSPPFFALRSYQDGGEHYDGQIGSETTPQDFLAALWAVTSECWRVLKPTGSLFVNLGDKYSGNNGASGATTSQNTTARNARQTFKGSFGRARTKSLMGLPWRYAIGCTDGRADPDGRGWILRQELIWSKPNGMPESVEDRGRRSHEQWFHMVKQGTYYADMDAVRCEYAPASLDAYARGGLTTSIGDATHPSKVNGAISHDGDPGAWRGNPLGKLPGSVWTIPTQPLQVPAWLDVDHFAAFPTEWPRRLISAWSPPGVCTECGEGRRSVTNKTPMIVKPSKRRAEAKASGNAQRTSTSGTMIQAPSRVIIGTECACPDTAAPTTPAVVLDPFGGTGTTAMVARALGRYGISMDLSADYLRLARWRIFQSGQAAKVADRTDGERQGTLL